METTSKNLQPVIGTVTKVSSAQTVRVETKVTKMHPLYRKRYTQVKHFIAHDQAGTAKVGDRVTIVMCKPVSKIKRWTIAQ